MYFWKAITACLVVNPYCRRRPAFQNPSCSSLPERAPCHRRCARRRPGSADRQTPAISTLDGIVVVVVVGASVVVGGIVVVVGASVVVGGSVVVVAASVVVASVETTACGRAPEDPTA